MKNRSQRYGIIDLGLAIGITKHNMYLNMMMIICIKEHGSKSELN